MSPYVDGFVFPIPSDRIDEYKRLAEGVGEIWKEHGALDYREFVGDDLRHEGIRSFSDVVEAKEGEAIVFGWVVFESRETRDAAGMKVATDPRVAELMAASNTGFDPARMAYGGFKPLVGTASREAG